MTARTTVESRVARLSKVDETSGCWVWGGSKDKDGYGKVRVKFPNGRVAYLAHRMTFMHFVGDIPDGKEVDHICKNTSCINPAHLRLLTHRENVEAGDYKTHHRNAVKTHCIHGHALTAENIRIQRHKNTVMRHCKLCAKDRSKKYNAERTKSKQMENCLGIKVSEA